MTTTDNQPAPHELLREEFCALAKAVRLSNHGRRWNVELGERYSAFSDAETAELALLDVHRAAVNNALFFNDPVQSGSLYGTTTLPPAHVLDQYPDLIELFPNAVAV